mmetsp:Transcript_19322/g.54255  ORF Transcript_19322/g.54255 Transcript_19322/m.54255 type:complete len:484 (+) Transcript_19322:1251-2702(+)
MIGSTQFPHVTDPWSQQDGSGQVQLLFPRHKILISQTSSLITPSKKLLQTYKASKKGDSGGKVPLRTLSYKSRVETRDADINQSGRVPPIRLCCSWITSTWTLLTYSGSASSILLGADRRVIAFEKRSAGIVPVKLFPEITNVSSATVYRRNDRSPSKWLPYKPKSRRWEPGGKVGNAPSISLLPKSRAIISVIHFTNSPGIVPAMKLLLRNKSRMLGAHASSIPVRRLLLRPICRRVGGNLEVGSIPSKKLEWANRSSRSGKYSRSSANPSVKALPSMDNTRSTDVPHDGKANEVREFDLKSASLTNGPARMFKSSSPDRKLLFTLISSSMLNEEPIRDNLPVNLLLDRSSTTNDERLERLGTSDSLVELSPSRSVASRPILPKTSGTPFSWLLDKFRLVRLDNPANESGITRIKFLERSKTSKSESNPNSVGIAPVTLLSGSFNERSSASLLHRVPCHLLVHGVPDIQCEFDNQPSPPISK